MRRPPDLASLRAAWWANRALIAARRALARGEVRGIELPVPPRLADSAIRGVDALLRRRQPSCLERALVRQRWLAAHGEPHAIAIGVTSPSQGFAAHAWLVGEHDPQSAIFHELTRLEP
ncbi:MAG: lasso peptide biosynthesis protein [Solirubrobacterales bacterium]|nr:lasso peptide biosynthesis protein [Solirubrobacterales bacterium]